MDNLEEEKLKTAFKQLADKARSDTPSFDLMWNEANAMKYKKRRRFRLGSIAASATLIIATSLSVLLYKTCETAQGSYALVALSEWKSPTDILLPKNPTYDIGNLKSFPSDRILDYKIKKDTEYILTDK